MEALTTLILGVAIIVAVLLAKRPPYVALAAAIVVMALFYGGPRLLARSLLALTCAESWSLAASIYLVASLATLYGETRAAARMGNEISKILKNDVLALTLAPSIMGLLPIPGGALMSAPIVEAMGGRLGPVRSTFINVWYEHLIVPIYPLEPTLMIASAVSGFAVPEIIATIAPLVPLMYITGLPVVGLRGSAVKGRPDLRALLKALAPIVIAAALSLSLVPLDSAIGVPRLSVLAAVLVALLAFKELNGVGGSAMVRALTNKRCAEASLLVLEACIMREVLLHMDISSVAAVVRDLKWLALVALPALLAFVGGHPSVGVAVATPVAVAVAGPTLNTVGLVYLSAFVSYLISPLHLCLVYTASYFRVPLRMSYRFMLPTAVALMFFTYLLLGLR